MQRYVKVYSISGSSDGFTFWSPSDVRVVPEGPLMVMPSARFYCVEFPMCNIITTRVCQSSNSFHRMKPEIIGRRDIHGKPLDI